MNGNSKSIQQVKLTSCFMEQPAYISDRLKARHAGKSDKLTICRIEPPGLLEAGNKTSNHRERYILLDQTAMPD